jgi:para-nitrobenzyl esterase
MDWRMPAIRLAEASARGGNPAWSYFANWTSGAGAVHSVLYDPPGKSLEPDDAGHGLFGQIAGAFAGMARDGTPVHGGLPDWPRYTQQQRATMIFDFDMRVEEDAWDARRQAWDGLR